MQVGSRALVTLRHSLAHFDQIRIIQGWLWLTPNESDFWKDKYKVIFKKQNSLFANMKSYLDTHLRVVHVVLIASEDV